ncbi:DUF4129 domain-containing protein [Leeuwenhoekiella sp. W20_SRS_FM14]|uniref:DUF4129 domain-containing protein n=1 Tax=Leeuwenhoekiella sp. W20_SRS_FM14 TaxID=3240270 RepID=UPI003F98A7E6
MQHPFYIVVLFFCVFSFSLKAEILDSTQVSKDIRYDDSVISVQQFDAQTLENFRQDEAFNYVELIPPDNLWTRFKTWLDDLWDTFINWILQGNEATGLLGLIVRALPYLLLLGVVTLLVWLFLKIDMGGSGLKNGSLNKVILTDEQQIIETQNIQELIDDALLQKNYQLAVRYYYLLLLQKLANKDIIDWQVQKTNADYVYEIKNNELRIEFTKLTRIYDFIWYGNFEVSESAFSKAEQEFKKTTATL